MEAEDVGPLLEESEQLASTMIRQLGDLSRELESLQHTDAWLLLRAEFEKTQNVYFNSQARKLTSGNISAPPVDQRAIDYQRGFFRGAEFILGMPERVALAHKRAVERQENQ